MRVLKLPQWIIENPGLLGCDTVFLDIVVANTAKQRIEKTSDTFFLNVGNQLPSDAPPHATRPKSCYTPAPEDILKQMGYKICYRNSKHSKEKYTYKYNCIFNIGNHSAVDVPLFNST
jgi:hypothetical protein